MDSSSDESFTWEKASTGNDDEDKEHSKINGEENKIKVKHEKNYNEKEEDNETIEPKAKKRKHRDKENSFDEVESPKKKKIKTEPECDSDTRKKNKKNANMSSINGYLNNSNEFDQQDDDEYLNMCVKQEQEYLKLPNPAKSKKSKRQQDYDFDNVDSLQKEVCDDDVSKKEKKSKKKKKHSSKDISTNSASVNDLHNNENNGDYIDNNVAEMHEPIRKSPKKKKRKESCKLIERPDSLDIEDKFSAEETKVQKYYNHVNVTKTNEYNNEESKVNDHSSNLENSMDKSDSDTKDHNPLKKQLQNSKNEASITIAISQNGSPKKKISIKPILQSTPNNVGSQSKSNPERLLDRIRFEEDPDSDIENTKDNNDTSSFLKKYLKQNESLQPISKGLQNGSEITNDDEIWILKCPHDIDIQKLHDTDFNLDSKSKIKINGETYCGSLDETESKITIMTSNKNNFIIKNIVANGTIHFRKRLPKPHVQEDNVMFNNQTDFIPLPETKCRHPLFGSNYKDAIKVRVRRARADSAAAELEVYATDEKKKKKKHKKDHSIKPKDEIDNDMSYETSPKIENDSDVLVKKSKKRKHSSNEESFKKRSKKIKLELDSADAWESEKAIEENLFNF